VRVADWRRERMGREGKIFGSGRVGARRKQAEMMAIRPMMTLESQEF